jgi:hypothetical protein
MILIVRWIGALILSAYLVIAQANPYDIHLQIQPNADRFLITADFKVSLSSCQASQFIRDYEAAKNFPGIKESKIVSRTGNQVLVERLVEDQILFIPIQMRSVVEYKEISDQVLEFKQITGDARFYQGTWHLNPEDSGTRFQYRALIELSSIVPNSLAEYFIKTQMTRRFEAMAENANQRAPKLKLGCP